MKTDNTIMKKCIRLISGFTAVMLMTVSFAGQASARILFEDDTNFNINSEGIILDYNDNIFTGTASTGTYTMADAVCITGETYTATINSTAVVYTAVSGDNCGTSAAADTIAILAGLSTAIDADGTVGPLVNAVATTNTITLTATAAGTAGNFTTTASTTSAAQVLVATGAAMTGGIDGDTIDIQFGADGSDALISYDTVSQDITLSTPGGDFDFSNDNLTTTGNTSTSGLTATGSVDLSSATEVRLREIATITNPGTSCTNVGEVIIETSSSSMYICTNSTTNAWTQMSADDADTLDGLDSLQFLRSDTSDNYTSGTLTFDAGTTLDLSAADLVIPTSATDPAACAVGEIYFNTTNAELMLCTATNTWTNSGPQDFEDVYAYDADNTLTASSTFDIDATGAVGIDSDAGVTIGGTTIGITADGGTLDLTGDGTNDINIGNAGAAIDIDSATMDILTTGAFSIDGTGSSNMSVTSGNLTLSTITAGDLYMTSVGDLTFTDQYDSLTFAQVSAGMGNDLLNASGEIYEATGTIGATIGVGETSTSIIHAINAVGTYATTIGAGATDDIDDVYNNGAAGSYFADVDTADTGYNITSTDGDGFSIQNSTINFADFYVNASDQSIIDFDPYDFLVDSTNSISLDAAAASNFTTSAGAITVDGASGIFIEGNASEIDITTTGATDMNTGTFTLDATSTFSIDGVGASNVTTDSGALTLSTTTTGDVSLSSADDITIYAGDDILFDDAQLTGIVQMTDVATDWDVYFTSDGIIDNINALATAVSINGVDLTFYPEYPDATVYADGSDNKGTLEGLYDTAQDTNYYNWTTTKATLQDINIQFMFVLPPDFSAIGTNGLQFEYRTGTAVTTDNKVDVLMYERTGAGATTACGSDLTNVNGTGAGGAFATGQITKTAIDGGCSLAAGDIVLIEVILYDNSGAADFADVGYITLDYDN